MNTHTINYSFDKGNLLSNPNHYRYTDFFGLPFLDSYLTHRQTCLKQIRQGLKNLKKNENELLANLVLSIPESEWQIELCSNFGRFARLKKSIKKYKVAIDFAVDSGAEITEILLDAMIKYRAYGGDVSYVNYLYVLECFRKNMETKRLIYDFYEKKLRIGQGSELGFLKYAEVSALLGMEQSESLDLTYLNALLKVNDILSAYISEINDNSTLLLSYIGINTEIGKINWLRRTIIDA